MANKLYKFDENDVNILTDAAYQASTSRTNGNATNSIASSELINKALKQCAAVTWALGEIVANNNSFDATDSNPSNIALGLMNALSSLRFGTFTTTGDQWNVNLSSTFESSKPILIAFACTQSSVANQMISISSGTAIPIKVYSGDSLGAGDITASSSTPFLVVLAVYNDVAYCFRDYPKAKISGIETNIATLGVTKADKSVAKTATLTSSGWSGSGPYTQTVSVTGITASQNLIITFNPTSYTDWTYNEVRCSSQGAGTLTFTSTYSPSNDITVNILIAG